MTNAEQQALAEALQKELDRSPSIVEKGIPDDLLSELFEWKKEHDIRILAIKSLEDILKNYF